MKQALKAIIPRARHGALRRLWNRTRAFGLARFCPVCGSHLRAFLPHGVVVRPQSVCPVCATRERHRLAWLYFERETDLFSKRLRVLHVAPELEIQGKLRGRPNLDYVSIDVGCHAMLAMDVCRMSFTDAAFDAIYCSHVLNMLPDDRPAMYELRRVLRPGGWMLLQVPLGGHPDTVETSPQDGEQKRRALFGDPMMYRRYGVDIAARLQEAGFEVNVRDYQAEIAPRDRIWYGLIDEPLVVCC